MDNRVFTAGVPERFVKEEPRNGKSLNAGQSNAISELNEFAKKFSKQLNILTDEPGKQLKKQAQKAAQKKAQQEVARVKEILIIQDVLQNMGQDNVRQDFLEGRNGAAKLTQEEIKCLDDLYCKVVPKHGSEEGLPPFKEQLQLSAEHLLAIVDGKTKGIVGTTYAKLKELVNTISLCGYFDQVDMTETLAEEAKSIEFKTGVSKDQLLEGPCKENAVNAASSDQLARTIYPNTARKKERIIRPAATVRSSSASTHPALVSTLTSPPRQRARSLLSSSLQSEISGKTNMTRASNHEDIINSRKYVIDDRIRSMKVLQEHYIEHGAELLFLRAGGNMMDYNTWRKGPSTPQCLNFLRLDPDDNEANNVTSAFTGADFDMNVQSSNHETIKSSDMFGIKVKSLISMKPRFLEQLIAGYKEQCKIATEKINKVCERIESFSVEINRNLEVVTTKHYEMIINNKVIVALPEEEMVLSELKFALPEVECVRPQEARIVPSEEKRIILDKQIVTYPVLSPQMMNEYCEDPEDANIVKKISHCDNC